MGLTSEPSRANRDENGNREVPVPILFGTRFAHG